MIERLKQIKFRGLRIDKDKWAYGLLAHHLETDEWYISSEEHGGAAYVYKVRPETIGRYIGIKDTNGLEIYEDDFLKLEDTEVRYLVKYNIDEDYPAFDLEPNFVEANSFSMLLFEDEEFYIIGNKHQNPELLAKVNNERD